MRVAHLSLDLSPRYKGRHGVYNDDVQRAASDEGIRYLQGLFAVIRLGEVEVLEVHADSLGVGRVEGVLGVDESGEASCFLRLGDDVQGESRLAARLRTEDLHDPASGDAANAEGDVEGQGAGRNGGDALALLVAHAHDRTLPELPLYLRDGGVYSLALIQCILHKANVPTPNIIGIFCARLYCSHPRLPTPEEKRVIRNLAFGERGACGGTRLRVTGPRENTCCLDG